MLRVLHLSTADLAGGAEKNAWKLHHALRERGHESLLVVGSKRSDDPTVIAIENSGRQGDLRERPRVWLEHHLGVQGTGYPGSRRIPELVGRRWDIIHAHNLHGFYFDLAALPRLSRVAPVVVTLQDMWLLTGHCAHPPPDGRWQLGCGNCPDLTIYPAVSRDATAFNLRRKRRIVGRSVAAVTSPGRWLLDLVAQSYLRDLPRRWIPNVVDTTVFEPGQKAAARRELGLPQDRPVVLLPANVGSANAFKDPSLFYEALRRLDDLDPVGIAFGNGDSTTRLRLLPLVDDEERLALYFRAADIVAYPSRADTSPLGVLEALASARPVVGTRVGGIPELVRDGETGVLVDPGDAQGFARALRCLLESPQLQSTMGERGRSDARELYDIAVVTDRWCEWYAEVASRR
jgi:glycosyltransferase involved in cell wall biosynthesis